MPQNSIERIISTLIVGFISPRGIYTPLFWRVGAEGGEKFWGIWDGRREASPPKLLLGQFVMIPRFEDQCGSPS